MTQTSCNHCRRDPTPSDQTVVGSNPADVALAWVLHNPVVTTPIIGPRTMEQLSGSLRAFEIFLSEDTLQQLDEIWPDPGGRAPEANAW